jgi:hypothetical protein
MRRGEIVIFHARWEVMGSELVLRRLSVTVSYRVMTNNHAVVEWLTLSHAMVCQIM